MRTLRLGHWLATALILPSAVLCAQNRSPRTSQSELRLHIQPSPTIHRSVPAVVWLEPMGDTPVLSLTPQGHYTLLQKNRTFIPHLQVVPVGSVVQFPNADPFFHNVFSLFDGKRFDLGLYEAGSTKSVTFSREGVSYIFCNIHPEMSAVVLALSTRLFAVADSSGSFHLPELPGGEYEMHVWIEGVPQPTLGAMTRRVHLSEGATDLGKIEVPGGL